MSADTLPPLPYTLDDFFREAEEKNLTVADILPRVLAKLAEQGDPDAMAALAAKPPNAALCHPAATLLEVPRAQYATGYAWQGDETPPGPGAMMRAEQRRVVHPTEGNTAARLRPAGGDEVLSLLSHFSDAAIAGLAGADGEQLQRIENAILRECYPAAYK